MNESAKPKPKTVQIEVRDDQEMLALFGRYDENLRIIQDRFAVRITGRGNSLGVSGPESEVRSVMDLFDDLLSLIRQGKRPQRKEILYLIKKAQRTQSLPVKPDTETVVRLSHKQKIIEPQSEGQKEYLQAMDKHDIVFSIGPAGTGKTYLAMAAAIQSLERGEVDRIILARPAVEAGESLGFLPGDLAEKVNPYLRPLYDALYEMMDTDKIARYQSRGAIEVAPLAFMRGRTLNDSFILLDEAQNTTTEQMKMFLTRLGFDSKTVITGDITQVDLPSGRKNGLVDAKELLTGIDGIAFVKFNRCDVVRHPLVQDIIHAYEKQDLKNSKPVVEEEN